MNAYEFLLTLGFWQWLGLIILSTIICACIVDGMTAVFNRKKP